MTRQKFEESKSKVGEGVDGPQAPDSATSGVRLRPTIDEAGVFALTVVERAR